LDAHKRCKDVRGPLIQANHWIVTSCSSILVQVITALPEQLLLLLPTPAPNAHL
jgi:hypothetical protein